MFFKFKILFFFALCCSYSFSQSGPGQIRDSSSTIIWLRSGYGTSTTTDLSPVAYWVGQLNGHNVNQTNPAKQPLYHSTINLNSQPLVYFDGIDDQLKIPNHTTINTSGPYSERSICLVIKTGSDVNSRQLIFEEGGKNRGINIYIDNHLLYLSAYSQNPNWGYHFVNDTIHADSSYIVTLQFDAKNSVFSGYVNGQHIGESTGIGELGSHGGGIAVGAINGRTVFHDDVLGTGTHNPLYEYEGYVAEMAQFSSILNSMERKIVENHLSAKFNIPLRSNDLYTGDTPSAGECDLEVSGIGRDNFNNVCLTAHSGGLKIEAIVNLDDGDYVMAGHNKVTNTVNFTDVSGMSGINNARWERVWHINSQDSQGALQSDISFDFSDAGVSLAPTNASNYVLLYRTAEGQPWTEMMGASYISGDQVVFMNLSSYIDGFYTLGSLDESTSPLPIELGDFVAEQTQDGIELSWTTLSETNNDYFEILRSSDGVDFQKIGTVHGAGNSDRAIEYSFLDRNFFPGNNYYQLSQVDIDASTSRSKIIAVRVESTLLTPTFGPNPIRSQEKLNVLVDQPISVKIYSINGQLILHERMITSGEIDITSLKPGTYVIKSSESQDREDSNLLVVQE